MIIVKMNSSTVECSIAASELREIGLTPESVINGEKKSTDFLEQLNKEVGEQLDYNPEREVLLMSKNMMSDGSVRIFAMKMTDDDIERTAHRIRESATGMLEMVSPERIEAIKQQNGQEKAESLANLFIGVTDMVNHIYAQEENGETHLSATSKPVSDYERYLLEVSSLDQAIRLAKRIVPFPVEDARLYKSDGSYYLLAGLRSDDVDLIYEFRKTCIEYAESMYANAYMEPHIIETGDCLIEADALKRLADLGK